MHRQSQHRDVVEPVTQLADDLPNPKPAKVSVVAKQADVTEGLHRGIIADALGLGALVVIRGLVLEEKVEDDYEDEESIL